VTSVQKCGWWIFEKQKGSKLRRVSEKTYLVACLRNYIFYAPIWTFFKKILVTLVKNMMKGFTRILS